MKKTAFHPLWVQTDRLLTLVEARETRTLPDYLNFTTGRCRPKAAILIILDPTFSGNDRHPDPDLCVREQLEVEV